MAGPGEFAGKVIGQQDLAGVAGPVLHDRHGLPGSGHGDGVRRRWLNALVGAVEAHASRAEDAYRRQGADPGRPGAGGADGVRRGALPSDRALWDGRPEGVWAAPWELRSDGPSGVRPEATILSRSVAEAQYPHARVAALWSAVRCQPDRLTCMPTWMICTRLRAQWAAGPPRRRYKWCLARVPDPE